MTKTILELTGVTPVSALMAADKHYRLGSIPMAANELILGIELELENWDRKYRGDATGLFQFHEDGSLRNNGREYVSLPTRAKYMEALLSDFFSANKVTAKNYSERTSTHIHVNVQDYTQDQLAALALIYQVFERLLLNFVGEERANNIFCVPWCQANITTNLAQVIKTGNYRNLRNWSKYTALNLLAVTQKGTVEYRHLYGTCDLKVILDWINIISSMHEYARVNKLEDIEKFIVDLNTTSSYEVFLHSVFNQWAEPLKISGYKEAMEQGVIDAKLMLTDENGLLKSSPPPVAEPEWLTQELERIRIRQAAMVDQVRAQTAATAPARFGDVITARRGTRIAQPAIRPQGARPGQFVVPPGQPLPVEPIWNDVARWDDDEE